MIHLTDREWEQAGHYDAFHTARAASPLVSELYARAMGDAYPAEVAPYSSCDWPLLGTLTSRLKLRPGQLLADIGCGTGGVGLWLARALNTRLVGIDVSAKAVRLALERRTDFVGEERAHFAVGSLETTGLPDTCAHALICIDALSNAADRIAALTEFHRILAPGGRAVMTRTLPAGGRTEVRTQARAAGLTVEHIDTRPGEPELWHRVYQLWTMHEDRLRLELGHDQAANMLAEAHRMQPRLATRRALIVTLRRPGPRRGKHTRA
ncbi:class I SAM-dependent methyltransferase [Streptomyces justiciae]|uniref:class I SAM-dependent methyltransferase n=1 Tax=Streptomyces justiciae TaxID=2780140 RepID=UPI0021193817|nr:class I SAM-dependent methyltransferase [Streptomyces justiciae]MCW8382388.1 class I SAM-dependent methyltransferase [Streptomyces justiciae]